MAGGQKAAVRAVVEQVISGGRFDLIDALFIKEMRGRARRWFEPFRESFPDVQMEIIELVEEGETVVGRFTCSGTQTGPWQGHEASGRRFENVDEVYFFRFEDGRIAAMGARGHRSPTAPAGHRTAADRPGDLISEPWSGSRVN